MSCGVGNPGSTEPTSQVEYTQHRCELTVLPEQSTVTLFLWLPHASDRFKLASCFTPPPPLRECPCGF